MAGGIDIGAAAPQTRFAFQIEHLDQPVVARRQQVQCRQQARTEIRGVRDDFDAELIGECGDLQAAQAKIADDMKKKPDASPPKDTNKDANKDAK